MNLHYYHRLMEALELLTFFVFAPALAVVIAYRAWREKHDPNPKRYLMRCVASGVAAALLIVIAQWIGTDVRTPQFLLPLAPVLTLLGLLLFGVCMGCFFPILLGLWRWHKRTRLN